MLNFFTLVVLALGLTISMGTDLKARLRMRPPVMQNFNPTMRMGLWFNHYWFAPCSWEGSREYEDKTVEYQRLEKGVFRVQMTWRLNGQCTISAASLFPTKLPGVYKLLDSLGNILSGEYQVVATDFFCFGVVWGCTKTSVMDNTCEDPWLAVQTRESIPNPKCLHKADQVLATVFQISLRDMYRIPQGNGCLRRPHPSKKPGLK